MYVRVLFSSISLIKVCHKKMGCDGIRHAGEMERKRERKKRTKQSITTGLVHFFVSIVALRVRGLFGCR